MLRGRGESRARRRWGCQTWGRGPAAHGPSDCADLVALAARGYRAPLSLSEPQFPRREAWGPAREGSVNPAWGGRRYVVSA